MTPEAKRGGLPPPPRFEATKSTPSRGESVARRRRRRLHVGPRGLRADAGGGGRRTRAWACEGLGGFHSVLFGLGFGGD